MIGQSINAKSNWTPRDNISMTRTDCPSESLPELQPTATQRGRKKRWAMYGALGSVSQAAAVLEKKWASNVKGPNGECHANCLSCIDGLSKPATILKHYLSLKSSQTTVVIPFRQTPCLSYPVFFHRPLMHDTSLNSSAICGGAPALYWPGKG